MLKHTTYARQESLQRIADSHFNVETTYELQESLPDIAGDCFNVNIHLWFVVLMFMFNETIIKIIVNTSITIIIIIIIIHGLLISTAHGNQAKNVCNKND